MVDVKICGVCHPSDARMAAEAGAAYVGVILAAGRTRSRSIAEAAAILDASDARRVAVFVDAAPHEVIAAAADLSLDAVQLHGAESATVVRSIRDAVQCDVWKALRLRDPADVAAVADAYSGLVDALLLDGWSPEGAGGVGARFDWDAVERAGLPAGVRIIVAGGLTPDNVASVVAQLRPALVDVSSGVESSPGRKSPGKVRAFVAAARGMKGLR